MEFKSSLIPDEVLPSREVLTNARAAVHTNLSSQGIGSAETAEHIASDLVPGFSGSSRSSRYFGFVTGGSTPAATAAEHVAVEWDQNVQVHLPDETVATDVEYHALRMLAQLVGVDVSAFEHKIFTTGATASNVVGLACGREWVVAKAAERRSRESVSVAEKGILRASALAGVRDIRVLTSAPHSSLRKACSVVGLGHDCVVDVGRADAAHTLDLSRLETELAREHSASIIAISCSEVNTGLFATTSRRDLERIRQLADKYRAWVHVDAAFGLMSGLLPDTDEFADVRRGIEGLDLVDSIAGDAHKLVNVPYDCGFFFSKHLTTAQQVFQNPGAVYLASSASAIPAPLNMGLENSRRFRALPVYANLVAYGKHGFSDMIVRQVRFARRIAEYFMECDKYDLLPEMEGVSVPKRLASIYIIVLFRAKDEALNDTLVTKINGHRRIYCSGTKWQGKAAVRFAVANWRIEYDRDWPVVREVLDQVVA